MGMYFINKCLQPDQQMTSQLANLAVVSKDSVVLSFTKILDCMLQRKILHQPRSLLNYAFCLLICSSSIFLIEIKSLVLYPCMLVFLSTSLGLQETIGSI